MAEALEEKIKKILAEKAALEKELENLSTKKAENCKVSVKLPPFWPNKPAVWFAQVEAQFEIAGIVADKTMYNYVVGQIDHKLAGEIEDIITKPLPLGQQYEILKSELIKRLSMSETQKVRQLLSEEELGDRKPSQFLRHLRSLAGISLSDENILRQLWMRRLPQNIQAILASQSDLALDKLAELADKIVELSMPSSSVFTTTATAAPPADAFDNLVSKVEELTKQVHALSSRGRSRSSSRSFSSRRSSRSSSPTTRRRCWYHKRFGQRAVKCIAPCDWMSENTRSVVSADEIPILDIKTRSTVFEVNDNKVVYCEGRNVKADDLEWLDNNDKVSNGHLSKNSRIYVERSQLGDKALLVLFLRNLTMGDSGNWTCRTKKQAPNLKPASVKLIVGEKTEEGVEETKIGKENGQIRLECKFEKGSPPPEIQWDKEGEVIDGKTKGDKYILENKRNVHTLIIKSLSHEDEGKYRCKATQRILSHVSHKYFNLEVIYKPILIHPETKTQLPLKGDSGSVYEVLHEYAIINNTKNITCSVNANPPPQFKWSKDVKGGKEKDITQDSIEIEGEDDPYTSVLPLFIKDSEDAGIYKCTATNERGHAYLLFDIMLGDRPSPPNAIVFNKENTNYTHMPFTVTCSNCTFIENPEFTSLDPHNLPVIGYNFQLEPYELDTVANWDNGTAVSDFIVKITQPNDTVFYIGPLANGTKYHVRVRTMNVGGFSDWLEYAFTGADNMPYTKQSVRLACTSLLIIAASIVVYFN